ncbi:MAG: OmpH family outer membrane protein [Bryobacteraceae bacterium]
MKLQSIALPALVLILSGAAVAQTATKVGVIQAQSALISTKDGQKAVAELDTRLAPRKKDLERKQAEIKDLQDKLQRGGNAMAEPARNDLMRSIDLKTKSFNRDMEDAQAESQQEQRKLLDDLSQKMMAVIDKYAQSNGYSLILDVSNPNTPVLYAANAVDITKEIIDLYDKSASSPAAAPAKPAAAPPKPAMPPATPPAAKKQP